MDAEVDEGCGDDPRVGEVAARERVVEGHPPGNPSSATGIAANPRSSGPLLASLTSRPMAQTTTSSACTVTPTQMSGELRRTGSTVWTTAGLPSALGGHLVGIVTSAEAPGWGIAAM